MTAMTALEASTTTNASPTVSRTTYCKDVPSIDDPNELLFDFMDTSFIRAVQGLPTKGAVIWAAGASLSTLSYDYYGVSNGGALILMFNGFISASHIPPGSTVNIPDISSLKGKLSATKRGTVTRI